MDYILSGLYLVISVLSLYYSWKGFSTKKVIFKKGVKGTKLEDSKKLALVQASLLALVSICTALYAYYALTLF